MSDIISPAAAPAAVQDRVLFKDPLMLVLDKPAGIPVHAGPGGGTTLESWLPHLRFGYKELPQLAHRLDRDTSGCLVLGRNQRGLKRLGRLFMTGHVEKTYWAVVLGGPAQDQGRIDAPLKKVSSPHGGFRMQVQPGGQTAVTDWRVLGRAEGFCWIECHPRTGRTHQIRVHLAHLGCPIVGDPHYGDPSAVPGAGLHLHARAVTVPLYWPEKPPITVQAPVPGHLLALMRRCGLDADGSVPAAAALGDG